MSMARSKAPMGYGCDKRMTRENMTPLHKEKRNLVFWVLEKPQKCSTTFCLFCLSTTLLASVPATLPEPHTQKVWENKLPPAIGEDQVWDHLRKKAVHKPMEPDKTKLWVPRPTAAVHIWEATAVWWSSQ